MNADLLLGKKERLREITKLLESPGYEHLTMEIQRLMDAAVADVLNLQLNQTRRDAAAGAHEALGKILKYAPALAKSLEATIDKQK